MHTQTFQKIAVWQTAFLGDAVLTLPLVQTLAKAYPKAEIHFFVRGGVQSLFAAQPELTSVTGFAKRGNQKGLDAAREMAGKLKSENFDLLVSAHTSFRSAFIAHQSRIATRIGYSRPLYNRLAYTHTVARCFAELEEIERLLQLVKPLGISSIAKWPNLTISDEADKNAAELLGETTAPTIGLHPGSVWATKRWPVEYFSSLADIAMSHGVRVAVFAGPGEEDIARQCIESMSARDSGLLLDLSGKPDLPTLAACLGRLDCYASNDSGPMHMAWAQHTPVVAFFGPTVRSLGFYPRGERSTVLEHDVSCRPCGLHGGNRCKPGHHDCMRQIKPEQAWAVIERELEKGRDR